MAVINVERIVRTFAADDYRVIRNEWMIVKFIKATTAAILTVCLAVATPTLIHAQNSSGTGGQGGSSTGANSGGAGNGTGTATTGSAGNVTGTGTSTGMNGTQSGPAVGQAGAASNVPAPEQNGGGAVNPDGSQNSGINGGQTTSAPTGSSMNLGSLTNQPGPQGAGVPSLSSNAPAVYNLPTAIQSTIDTSSDLAIAQKDLARDQAIVQEQASNNLPKINAGATYTHLDSPIAIAFGGTPIVVQPENTQAFNATGVLPLDISGQVRAATQAAQLQVMADRFNLDRIKNGLILNAQTAYFNVLRAQHEVQVDQSALTDAQTQYNTAQTQYKGGIGQKIDVLRADTQVSQAQQNLLQAQNALALSQENFNDVVGKPLPGQVTVQDVPGVTVGTTIANVDLNAPIGSSTGPTPSFFAPPASDLNTIIIQNDLDVAEKARPELREDLVEIQAASKQIFLARESDQPTFSLGATGDYYPVTDFQTPRHSLGIFTATINVPIFDGGLAQDKVRAARDTRDASSISYASDKTNVELQVRQAYLNLYTASNQIAAANSALQEAIAARQLAEVRYANGVGLYLEVTDAESALTNAENSQVNAVYDYLIARAQYQNAVGTPTTVPTL
jgi:outer membrane protein